jgi:predicted ATP-grasp superfamily ATP-dependent carboligase
MHAERRTYLVAAISGRALAASAARGGHAVVVLDCFADRDTRDITTACRSVVASHGLRLDRRRVLAAASELAPASAGAGVVCGSGFEGRTALLAALAAGRTLHGNRPEVVASVKQPRRLFPLLDRLELPYPAVRFDPPVDPAGWLVKRAGGAGGAQVRWADAQPIARGEYLQRFTPGRTLSALFLADGRRALLLGFNEQWTCTARPATPFLFGGA